MSRTTKSLPSEFYQMAIDALIKARTGLALSQYDLARKWNRHQSVIAKIETCDRRLELIEFIDLCIILEIDPAATIAHIHGRMCRKRPRDA